MVGASRIGRRLLAILNDGVYRLLLDFSEAQAIAPPRCSATLLRIDRYAARRGARMVVVTGAAMERDVPRRQHARAADDRGHARAGR